MDDEEKLDNVDEATDDELEEAMKNEKNRKKSKIEQAARDKAKDLAKKGKNKLKGTMFKSVGLSIGTVAASVIIVIFMSVGIISYIVSMPGFVQQKMYDLVDGFAKGISQWWSGSNKFLNNPNDPDFEPKKIELLNYLNDMGLNPVGLGFVVHVARDSDGKIMNYISDSLSNETLKKITGSPSGGDLLYKYIVASERTYVLNDDGLAGIFGINNTHFKGMLSLIVKNQSLSDFTRKISVDRTTKNLSITESDFFKSASQTFYYDLDSWVGRYGKPIELLLALHISTMSPDLTEEFIENPELQTNVQIEVENEKYDADYTVRFKDEEGNMQESPVKLGKTGIDPHIEQDRLYEKMMQHLNIDFHDDGTASFVYENTDDISAEDITISGLYELITSMNHENSNTYTKPDGIDLSESILNTGIDRFIGPDDPQYTTWYMVKTTTGPYEVLKYHYRVLPYLADVSGAGNGTWDFYNPNVNSGILNPIPDSELYRVWDSQTENIDGNDQVIHYLTMQYDGYNIVEELRICYQRQCCDNSGSNYGIKVNTMPGLSYFIKYPEDYFRERQAQYRRNCDRQTPGPMDVFNANNESILAMLLAFDQYVYEYQDILKGKINWYEFNTSSGEEPYYDWVMRRVCCETDPGATMHLNLSKEWIDFARRSDINNDNLKQELTYIRNRVIAYRNIIQNRNVYIQQFVDDILAKEIGEDARGKLKIADIKKIYETLYDAPSEVKFDEPRILYVVNHWFKDIDFRQSYEKIDSTKDIKVDVGTADLDVVMNLSGKHYTQTSQPYVIKGNTVTVEGEDKKKEYDESFTSEQKATDAFYKAAGNGYRAAKKLFTQGQYYVYDGTEETSKGIYYNKVLEKVKPGECVDVRVKNGRIVYLQSTDASNIGVEGTTIEAWDTVNNKKLPVEIKLYNTINSKKDTGDESINKSRLNIMDIEKCYYVKVNASIEYKSPVQYTYEESVKSAENINYILDALGIVNQRQVVSFGTAIRTTQETVINKETGEEEKVEVERVYSGESAMLTAFNVLENMHTESAEHIYRDLKEFLIDLGYYTSAEFDHIKTNVLQWFIPGYVPDESANWKQNKDSDSLSYGAVMYPKQKDENGEEVVGGFDVDLNVVAPGDCKIIKVKNDDTITLEFDGISQPRISLLNGYSMIISGIKLEQIVNTDQGELSLEDAITSHATVKCNQVIGRTTDKKIVVIMLDNKGAYLSNVEDYMAPASVSANLVMIDADMEQIAEFIWQFEGTSDANPYDGNYYTVEYPYTDVPTVGHGVTAATVATWEKLGYTGYIVNGQFVINTIQKEIVDNVSIAEMQKTLDLLDGLLDERGIVWGGNQKAAWISLYYNGWHTTVISILDDFAKNDMASVRNKWLNVCVDTSGTYTRGHQNRRATEWILFLTGEQLPWSEAWEKCYVTNEY